MSDTTNLTQPPGWNSMGRSQFGQPSVAAFGQPGSAPLPQMPAGINPLVAGPAAAPGAVPGSPPVVAQAPPGQVLPVGLPRANVPPMPNANPLMAPQASLPPTQVAPNLGGNPAGNISGFAAPGTNPANPPQLQSRPGMSPAEWQAHVASLYPVGGGLAP